MNDTGKAVIIEDDPDANDILAELVREKGYEPVQCLTGEAGLEAVRKFAPQVVLLDLMLPDLDGYKVCEALKLDRETNPIPVIMVTALANEDNQVRGYRVGADCYIAKPYTGAEIYRAIEEANSRRNRLAGEGLDVEVRFDLTSEINNLRSVNELLAVLFHRTTLSSRQIGHLRTALLEMGANAIEWGNKHDKKKLVTITAHIGGDAIRLTITDEGEGFDPGNLPHAYSGGDDPTAHFSIREMLGLREGGFGILMTRGLMDEVTFNEKGNSVTMVKRFINRKA